MAVRVRFFEVEGSAEEVQKLLSQLGKATTLPKVEEDVDENEMAKSEDDGEITAELAYHVLNRDPLLKDSHQALLETLYWAHPNLVGWKSLCAKLKLTEDQTKGVIGSFVRRVNQTPGIKRGMTFFVREAAAGKERRYGLVDAARTAKDKVPPRCLEWVACVSLPCPGSQRHPLQGCFFVRLKRAVSSSWPDDAQGGARRRGQGWPLGHRALGAALGVLDGGEHGARLGQDGRLGMDDHA